MMMSDSSRFAIAAVPVHAWRMSEANGTRVRAYGASPGCAFEIAIRSDSTSIGQDHQPVVPGLGQGVEGLRVGIVAPYTPPRAAAPPGSRRSAGRR